MSMNSPPGGGGFGGPPGGFGGPPGGGPPGGGGAFGGPPQGDPGGGYGPPPGGAPQGGAFGPPGGGAVAGMAGPPGGAPPGGGAFGGPPPGDPGGGYGPPPGGAPPGGGAFGPPPGGGAFGGPPPGDPGGGYGPPPGGAPPGGAFGGPPGGAFGGPPPGDPGGGYGPPPGGAPPGGAFGGPPGGFGPPQGGAFGGPMGPPPAKKGPPVGLIIGLGCGGLALIGIIVTVFIFLGARKAAQEIANAPELKGTSEKTPSIPGLPEAGDLKAELRDLREFKGSLGSARYFVGEIHNTGKGSLGFPMAKVVLYDAANTAVESGTCMSVVRVLPPGEKVPCNFLVTGNKTWTSHKVEITPQRSFFNGELAKLEITDVKFNPKKRVYGAHELEGKITNKSAFTAKGVMAIISLYDKADKIVGSAQVPVAGNNLATGTSARFEGKIFDVADTPEKWQVVAVGYSE